MIRFLCMLALLSPAGFVVSTASSAAAKDTLKVFVLAGQSNMQGLGAIRGNPKRGGGAGALKFLATRSESKSKYRHLIDDRGRWVARADVWVWLPDRRGPLAVGFGATPLTFGPELQFGHVIGDLLAEPVVLIKAAWGNKSLFRDFRPPSSGLPAAPVLDAILERAKKLDPQAPAAAIAKQFGAFYRRMIKIVETLCEDPSAAFPMHGDLGCEIAGFAWHQGWSDSISARAASEYQENLANLIRDLRRDLGVPELPVVIGTTGLGGRAASSGTRKLVVDAQISVAALPEFQGNVATVDTRAFHRPAEVSPETAEAHWNHNAETYFLIGDAMGNAMKELLKKRPPAAD